MKNKIINQIESSMSACLNNEQLMTLKSVLDASLIDVNVIEIASIDSSEDNMKYLQLFLASKQIEGCSTKTLKYYELILSAFLKNINMVVKRITTEDLRKYLNDYQKKNNCSKVSIDNVRRVFSSFFNWLEDENYIIKSPVRRIHKIKTIKVVKETYSSEIMQLLRDNCANIRDLSIIDFLSSTGIRVGELVRLNKDDIDFTNKECVVFGKGSKERRVYFDSSTKLHLLQYLEERTDDCEALFVSLLKPHKRLEIAGVEIMLRKLGKKLGIKKVHPHKFRRTMATNAIDKGMPVEQVQRLLGHTKIDTTMQYAMVDQNNVKNSYRKYIGK